jgi:hypothetical protein
LEQRYAVGSQRSGGRRACHVLSGHLCVLLPCARCMPRHHTLQSWFVALWRLPACMHALLLHRTVVLAGDRFNDDCGGATTRHGHVLRMSFARRADKMCQPDLRSCCSVAAAIHLLTGRAVGRGTPAGSVPHRRRGGTTHWSKRGESRCYGAKCVPKVLFDHYFLLTTNLQYNFLRSTIQRSVPQVLNA